MILQRSAAAAGDLGADVRFSVRPYTTVEELRAGCEGEYVALAKRLCSENATARAMVAAGQPVGITFSVDEFFKDGSFVTTYLSARGAYYCTP